MRLKVMFLSVLCAALTVPAAVASAASSPSVSTGSATHVHDTSAVLEGTVNPNGAATKYWFAWGPTPAYGSISAQRSAGGRARPVVVRVTAGKLLPGVTYHYRLYAQSRSGVAVGGDRTFKTSGHPLPGVITGAAAVSSASGATLTGVVYPNAQATTWAFQYGLSAGIYNVTTAGGVVPGGTTPVTVSQQVFGLQGGTTFHYRLIAIHGGFPASTGLDQTFTTFPLVRPFAIVHAATTPHHTFKKPFVFTTSGTVVTSGLFPSSVQCSGLVALRYFAAGREVALAFAPVQPNCAFSATMEFAHTFARTPGKKRPGVQRVTVRVTFRGNGYLAPTRARDDHPMIR